MASDYPPCSGDDCKCLDSRGALAGPWIIYYDRNPISAKLDWAFVHSDADPESPGYFFGYAESHDACLAEIAEIEDDHPELRR